MRTALAVMCLAVVAACGGHAQAEPEQPTSSSQRGNYTPSPTEEQAFYLTAPDVAPTLTSNHDDAALTTIATTTCDVFDEYNGDVKAWVIAVKAFTDEGVPAGEAGGFIAIAVQTYCPQYVGVLPG